MATRLRRQGKLINKKSDPLIEIHADFSGFADQLEGMHKYSVALAGVLGIWQCASKNKRGMWTKIMAETTKAHIRYAIESQGRSIGEHWQPHSNEYAKWKDEHGFPDTIWELTGSVKDNIVIRRRTGGYVVGLDQRRRVPIVQYGRNHKIGYGRKVRIEKYASAVEFGASAPARPLFNPTIQLIASEKSPEAGAFAKASIAEAIRIFKPKKQHIRKGVQRIDVENFVSEATLRATGGYAKEHATDLLISGKKISGFLIETPSVNKSAALEFDTKMDNFLEKYLSDINDPADRARTKRNILKDTLGKES